MSNFQPNGFIFIQINADKKQTLKFNLGFPQTKGKFSLSFDLNFIQTSISK
jgi:hypothetical protein